VRINQYIARAGVCSRRKAEDFIKSGSVFVNGKRVCAFATEVDVKKDMVVVGGEEIKLPSYKYYMFAKPVGYTVTRDDKYAKHTIFDLLPEDSSLIAVGRLDRDTSGLLLVTNDGDFAQNVIHPSKKIEKEYVVDTKFPITDEAITDLCKGVKLDDGPAKAKRVMKIKDNILNIVIEEGRKRIVKRMIIAVGNEVRSLHRNRIGDIVLDIPIGKYRELSEKEITSYVK
jgi:23S rRNA pseudouridine2605 synthase